MPVIAPPTLTPAGLSPDRADRPTFVARSIARDEFIKNFQIPELQVAIGNVFNNATEAFNSGVSATADAASSSINASQAAAASAATQWVSGTNYVVGDARWSPITKISYRRLIAGAGTTDPSADATNWGAIVMPLAAGGTGATTAAAARTALDIKQLQSVDYTHAANALTLKLNPTNLDFRSTTLTSGAPVNVSNAAQLTTTISSGSTGGTVSAVQSDIILIAINNAGTMELAWTNLTGGLNLDETNLITTVAEGGAGAADSANVIYSTTARTGVAYRVVGVFRSTQTVAGTWAQTPTLVQPIGGLAVIPKRLIQNLNFTTGAVATGTTLLPDDDTIPQITEGDQYMSLAITPTRASSIIEVSYIINFARSVATQHCSALFRDAVANALGSIFSFSAADIGQNHKGEYRMLAGGTSEIIFRVRAGGHTAGTTSFNGTGGIRKYGGSVLSSITIKEYAA